MDLGEGQGQKRPRSPGNGKGVAEIYQWAMMSSLSETPADSILVQEGGKGKEETIDEHSVHGEGEGEEDDDSILVQEGGKGKEETMDEHNVHGEGEGEEDDDSILVQEGGKGNEVQIDEHDVQGEGEEDDDCILVQEGGKGKEVKIDEHDVHGEGEEDDDEEDDDEDDNNDYGSKDRVINMAHWSDDDGREDCIDRLPLEINESRSFGPLLYTYRPDVEPLLKTTPLFDVISVKIRNGAGKYLFGKIMSEDHRSVVYVYNRTSSDCEYLGKEAFASLTGPYRALRVVGNVCIVLNVSVKESKEEHSKVEEVGRGIITWNYVRLRPGVFTDVVPGQCGSTEVTYTIIPNGVEALVGVRMIGRSIKNLYAKVVASTGRSKKKEMVLFNGTWDDAEESIRLSRSVLAVPFVWGSMLKIDVILGPDKTSHPTIFCPMKCSDEVQKPNCDYGTLEVKVQWSCVSCTI